MTESPHTPPTPTDGDPDAQARPPAERPKGGGQRWLIFAALVVALAWMSGVHHQVLAWMGYAPPTSELAGESVASFTAETLAGETVRFPEDYAGKLVLLKFWATWCPPCRGELPDVKATYAKFGGDGFEIIAISLDGAQGVSERDLRTFVNDRELTWTQVYEGADKIANQYGVRAIPTSFLIDGDSGEIVAAEGQLKGPYLQQTVGKLLAAKNDAG